MTRAKMTSVLFYAGVPRGVLVQSTLRSSLRGIKHWILKGVSELVLIDGGCSALIEGGPL